MEAQTTTNGNGAGLLSRSELRAAILAAATPKYQDVEGWGQHFRIRQMSVALVADIHERFKNKAPIRVLAAQLVHSLVDAAGELVFAEADIDQVMAMSAAEVIRIGTLINEFNGNTDKAVQAAEKNSEPQATDSSSG